MNTPVTPKVLTPPLHSGDVVAPPSVQVLSPRWPVPEAVVAAFTLRPWEGPPDLADGRSGFNLGSHVGDDPERVALRRALCRAELGVPAVYLNQVHGWQVQAIDAALLQAALTQGLVPTADASWTGERGVACVVLVADCLPVLLANRQGTWVGAAHAGWRGLAGAGQPAHGVLEAVVAAYLAGGESRRADDLLAWLGPCIGPEAFEVGAEVRAAFMHGMGAAAATAFRPGPVQGKYLANLPQLARLRLQALGVQACHGNDGSRDWCTVQHPQRYFSHRRDQQRLGSSGRMGAYIWLRN